ncbi:reverse transcriptase domain-containing protein [Tanacetum coccineum]
MKKLMKAKFLPENHRQEAFLDYHNLSQWNMTMEEVINEFDKLRMSIVAWALARDCSNPKTWPSYLMRRQIMTPMLHQKLIESRNLGMKIEGHPEPYQLTWLKKGNTVKVSKHCLVQFSIEGSNFFMKKTDFKGLVKTSPYVFTLVVVEENQIISKAPLQVQSLLKEFADVILDDIPPGLPAMRDIQHCIDFIPSSNILNRPAYRMNPKEFVEIQRQVTELLAKGLIRESMSPCAVPALLLHGSTIFSKIDLRSGYHQIQMRPGDEWKTSFKTRDGLYKWMVMPFGLSNAPSTFMRLMNQVFKHFIGHFVLIYFDDILIYSSSLEQHLSHLRQIIFVLRAQKLHVNGKKCHFLVTEVTFLGYIVTGSGIKMDPAKVEAIISWPTPSTVHVIRSFRSDDGNPSRAIIKQALRYKQRCCSLIPAESDSLPHAHAQTIKTYYKHQDSRITKAKD